ncbi:DUF3299 domain-containing protein [Tropicimonas isoalkanivorans]|uniref:DUF3299 domain-containing protein n=1 Tax=Tropicimonas isoalkanivorans TaxID=441112 RepID=A0A1I1DQA0_9RHOB|nr:DUF3299 domain-containing protein [Tropicimonas isoalkanivorans]SFB77014.1 hypothetical protein SAMN04488094_101408 [Tropicimonas isoalkanivorans]
MRKTLLALVGCLFAHVAAAQSPITWPDLIDPTAQLYEDPFRDLSFEQLEKLRVVAKAEQTLEDGVSATETRDEIEARLNDAKASLAEQGIDAPNLLSQRWVVAERRKKAAEAGNAALDGELVVLAGYAIPAPPADDGTPVAYLVPERGMCSHTPPPKPNQMVRVLLKGDWRPATMHEPVQVRGRLSLSDTTHDIQVVDGLVPMRAAYEMEATGTLTKQDLQDTADSRQENAWAAAIVERLRASGQLPQNKNGDSN